MFQIVLDVDGFSSENLSLKIDEERNLIVQGKVEIKTENSMFMKSFKKSFNISNCNIEEVKSTLSSDGILTIIAPKLVRKISFK